MFFVYIYYHHISIFIVIVYLLTINLFYIIKTLTDC